MEFLRAGEVLMRSTQPLLPFLAPSAYRNPSRLGAISRHCRPHQLRSRPLSSTCTRQQQGAAAARQEDPAQDNKTSTSADDFTDLINSALERPKGTPTAPAGRHSSAQRQQQPIHQDFPDRDKNIHQAAFEEILAGFDKPASTSTSNPNAANRPNTIAAMLDNTSLFGLPSLNSSPSPPPPPPLPEAAPFKLGPTVGRTIEVNPERGMDVGRAFRTLEMRCAQNSVKRDFMRQRFHERQGLKRKRLKRERWRRNFKEKFQGSVKMVQRMRKQGW